MGRKNTCPVCNKFMGVDFETNRWHMSLFHYSGDAPLFWCPLCGEDCVRLHGDTTDRVGLHIELRHPGIMDEYKAEGNPRSFWERYYRMAMFKTFVGGL